MDTQNPILTTKLFAPPPRPALVPRPRLVARLDRGLTLPLTLISAPAGFGKTTLVSEWRTSHAGTDFPLAWLSLDNEDNDPTRFLIYLVSSLAPLMPGPAETALGMLQSPQPPPLQEFMTGLINEINEYCSSFVLVLDDFHVISAQPVHHALTFILEHLPPCMHIVLLTRADPPLPIARMRVRDQLVELRAEDLRFTSGEAAMFLNQVMGLCLSTDDVSALEARTEGWIAGLQLAALSLHGHENPTYFISTFGGGYHYIVDYLVEEVLNRQPDFIREFLLQTSILERLTGALCDALTGRMDGQETLEQLETANLFVLPLDNECCWYRYHHLFADVLQYRLRHKNPGQLAELHNRAAVWFEHNGFVPEAISHALSAGDQVHTAAIIENHAMAMLMRGEAVTVLNWINSIAPLIQERLWLGIYQSWAFICTGQFDRLEPSLLRAEQRIASLGTDSQAKVVQGHIAAIRAFGAVRKLEIQRAIDLAHQALEHLPEGEASVRSAVIYTLGEAYWMNGDLAEAKRAFTEASRIDTVAGNILAAVLALSCVAMLLTEQGELHRAAETYQAAVQMATRSDGRMLPAAAQACLGLSDLAYAWNDLAAAEHRTVQALELGRRWGNPNLLTGALLMQARLRLAHDDSSGALESLREAEELSRGQGVTPATVSQVQAVRVRLWLAQGNLKAAEGWIRETGLDFQGEIFYRNQIAYLTLARILIAQGQADMALALLERFLVSVEALGQMGRALEVLLVQALALQGKGDAPRALGVLANALSLGQAEGYVRVYLDEGEPMARLLRRAGSRGIAPKVVAELLSQFDHEIGVPSAPLQPLIEPLTARELEVLHLVADGLSNQAIARQLVVALGTVKTHTASLYRKLDVASRSQAVARARDLGIL